MSLEIETDADTGNEILYFLRRERPYLYLRDATTKRFIKRLLVAELRAFMVVDYSQERAKKGNPLYIDALASSRLTPKLFPEREASSILLFLALTSEVARQFGSVVAKELLEEAGVEYGSEPRYPEVLENPAIHYVKVWKHTPAEKGKREEGTIQL